MNKSFDLAGAERLSAKELAGMREQIRQEARILADGIDTKSVTNEQLGYLQRLNDKLDSIDKIFAARKDAEARMPLHTIPFQSGTKSGPTYGQTESYNATKSLGDIFTDSMGFRTQTGNRPHFSVDFGEGSVQSFLKATVTTSTVSPDPNRVSMVSLVGAQPVSLLDFLPIESITGGSIDYLRETTFTNAAANVNEAGAKPEASLNLASVAVTPRVIAVHQGVTRQALQDVSQARNFVNDRLTYMVRAKAEQQIIAGTGAVGPPQQLTGFLSTANIGTYARTTDTNIDAIWQGIQTCRVSGYAEPDAIVMHPTNFTPIRLYKATSGDYSFDVTTDSGVTRLFGKPLILTTAITLNTALVGAFRTFSRVYTVGGVVSETGYDTADFTNNILRFLVEMRLDLAVFRPAAFCKVTALQ